MGKELKPHNAEGAGREKRREAEEKASTRRRRDRNGPTTSAGSEAAAAAERRAARAAEEEEARKAEEAQEALAKAAQPKPRKTSLRAPARRRPGAPRRRGGKPVVASKSRKRARDSGADDDAPAARTKPRLKKVKIERTGPLRRSTREGIKKKKGFYSQRAMELEAWKGTGTKDDPYDAR